MNTFTQVPSGRTLIRLKSRSLQKTGNMQIIENYFSRKLFIMKFHSVSALLIIVIMNIHNSGGLIIGHGDQVTGNEFNWVVKILGVRLVPNRMSTTQDHIYLSHCTGSIISELHILTAAHCFENLSSTQVAVVAGTADLTDTAKSEHRVRTIHKHPSYGKEILTIPRSGNRKQEVETSDVAVLTLETPLVFGDKIAEIPLPTAVLDLSPEYSLCKMAGWGADSTSNLTFNLLWTSMKMENHDQYKECQIRYKLRCGRHPNLATYTAGGDSGAGLMCKGAVAGVFTGSAKRLGSPAVFQSVFHFLPFIRGILEQEIALLDAVRKNSRRKQLKSCVCL